jgi:DNA-binding protein H-NS
MSNIEHLKKLEELQLENKRLTEKLFELSESVAKLRQARASAATRPFAQLDS